METPTEGATATTEDDAPAGGEDRASVGRNASSARDGRWQGRGEDGSTVPALGGAGAEAEPAARLYGGEDEETCDDVPFGDADEPVEIGDGGSASGVTLIDLARVAREIGSDGFLGDPDEKVEPTSPEDEKRRAFLRRHADAPGGLFRRHLVADAGTVARLDALGLDAPNAAAAIDVVRRSALLSLHARSPLRVPPLVIVGPPGGGKSRVAARLAAALATTMTVIEGGTTSDPGPISGNHASWRGSGPGRVSLALLDGPTASPIVLIDETDKVASYNLVVRPLDALLSLFEPTTARRFVDNYLELPMRAEGVIWVATANSVAGLPAPLLDRTVVLEMPPLGRTEARDAIRRIFRELLAEHGLPASELGDGALRRLERSGPRQARRALSLALGPALAAGRDAPDAADLAAAIALVERPAPRPRLPPKPSAPKGRAPVGFIRFSTAPSGAGGSEAREIARPRRHG